MRVRKTAAAAATAALMTVGLAATSTSAADEPGAQGPTSGVVDGRTFGPEDGYEVTTESYPVISGEEPLEVYYGDAPSSTGMTPMATWGTSYATSQEILQLVYRGKAKAAGNVFSGQRIVQVCIWYAQQGRTSPTVCSTATSNGPNSWTAGSERTVTFVDNLSINWPQTIFNIRTTRIDPRVY